MNKAVIFGIYEFVAYHFCTKLLEEGIEVTGIHQPPIENDNDFINKSLAIGRNANFQEVDIDDWLPFAHINDQTLIIINYYDYYIQRSSRLSNKQCLIEDFFQRNKQQIIETRSPIIKLLPVQWAISTVDNNDFLPIKECHSIYLPTIYGPWQPNIFLFQQALLKELQKVEQITLNEREWTEDAIYIEDVVRTSLELIHNPPGSYHLKSEMNNHWQKCADFLSISLNEYIMHERKPEITRNDIQVRLIKNKYHVSVGIEKQKKNLIFSLKG